jgi:DNA-3-methyladenine glycosylase
MHPPKIWQKSAAGRIIINLMTALFPQFFLQPTLQVARGLLGMRLVRCLNGQRLSGLIVETEAYIGPADSANHARKGRTPRTAVMFGPPGQTYVYLVYGMHYMLNLVTEADGFPAAVLIRALEPVEGREIMHARRGVKREVDVANGPGKLCRALGIELSLNNWDIGWGEELWLEPGHPLPAAAIAAGPRIGIGYAHPKDQAALWRFWVRDNRFVSRP